MVETCVSFKDYDEGQIVALRKLFYFMQRGDVRGVEGLVNELERVEGPEQGRETVSLWQNGYPVNNTPLKVDRYEGPYDCTGAAYTSIQVPDPISLRKEK